MVDHFAALGFVLNDPDELQQLAMKAANAGTAIETPNGFYIHWSLGNGVEIWAQANLERDLIGCHPHFSGTGRVRAAVTSVQADQSAPLDGSVHAWADPSPGQP